MTAEIAVMNKTAVALAADSAVSIGSSPNNKIYTSVDKLFLLMEDVPVGIMVNGVADFLGIPWETIIKAYRNERRGNSFPELVNYRDDFLEFVSSHEKLFPSNIQAESVGLLIQFYLYNIRKQIKDEIDRRIEQQGSVVEQDVAEIAQLVIRSINDNVKSKQRLLNFDRDFVKEIREQSKERIKRLREQIFGNLPLKPTTKNLVITLVMNLLTRDCTGPHHTGLVFAGFGQNEYTPRLYAVNVESMINSRIRAAYDESRSIAIGDEVEASITPFAQSEMVQSFINGIHPKLAERMDRTLVTVFENLYEQVLEVTQEHDSQLFSHLRESLNEAVPIIVNELRTDWDRYTNEHSKPIIANVDALPKDELGAMAESLVNLTKFRRRISQDRETVSGPIDVAVISKGDGFIWVKHKHYFTPELNPRKMSRYNRSP